jgi:hypothetical protein
VLHVLLQEVVTPVIEMFQELGFSFATLLSFSTHVTKCVMITCSPYHLFHCADVSRQLCDQMSLSEIKDFAGTENIQVFLKLF